MSNRVRSKRVKGAFARRLADRVEDRTGRRPDLRLRPRLDMAAGVGAGRAGAVPGAGDDVRVGDSALAVRVVFAAGVGVPNLENSENVLIESPKSESGADEVVVGGTVEVTEVLAESTNTTTS